MKKISVIVIILLFVTYDLFSQCSDAGICSIRNHKESLQPDTLHNQIGITYLFGKSAKKENVTYNSVRLNGTFYISEGTSLSFILPFNSQSGSLGNTSGIGDLIGVVSQRMYSEGTTSLDLQAGVKFATGNANADTVLPQWYQSGLGSTDILFGASVRIELWDAAIGFQLAGTRNDNIQTRLKRGDDLYLRAGYTIEIENFKLHPSILFIKRLGESSIRDYSSAAEKFVTVSGSDQSQLNFAAEGQYKISPRYLLNAALAIPLLKRTINVDGLTRAITLSFGLNATI